MAHIDVHRADLVGDQALDLLHLCSRRVAIIRICSEALRADELPPRLLTATLPCCQTYTAWPPCPWRCTRLQVHAPSRYCSCPASVVRRLDALLQVAVQVYWMAFQPGTLSRESRAPDGS